MENILCSACLLGVRCTYDGKSKKNDKVLALLKKDNLIPVCPEQLGGLATPREPAQQRADKVVTENGKDVTSHFKDGAEQTLLLAKLFDVKRAILKQRSPSCGCGQVYDGTFSKTIIEGNGVTATLLKNNGVTVTTEEDL